MRNPNNPESGRAYAQNRDFDKGPATYSDDVFLQKIAAAAGLNMSAHSLLVADLACGPGKLASGLQRLYPQHSFLLIDTSPEQIEKAQLANPNKGNQFVVADIRHMPEIASHSVGAAIARYALKDLTLEEKIPTLQEIRRIMQPGSLLAVADMVAPTSEVRDWLNEQHGMKQEFEWRNPKTEGHCYIPTTEEWVSFMETAGFFPVFEYSTHMSYVATKNWLVSHQINETQKGILDQFILQADETVKEAFNIRTEKDAVTGEELIKIDYPLTIITAITGK